LGSSLAGKNHTFLAAVLIYSIFSSQYPRKERKENKKSVSEIICGQLQTIAPSFLLVLSRTLTSNHMFLKNQIFQEP